MNSPPLNRSPFLPEFLFGDETQLLEANNENGMVNLLTSPTSPDASFVSPSTSLAQHVSPNSLLLTSLRPDYNRGAKARLNGPPIVSLFDETPPKSEGGSTSPSSPTNQMETSPSLPDSGQNSEGYWIIVFGFPPSHSAHILSIFNQLGNVIEHSIPPVGNWMLLKYRCRTEVRKALTYDKRIVNGSIMIAVTEKKNINQMRPIIGTPNSSSYTSIRSPMSPVTSPRMRHLTSSARDIQGNEPPVPQRNNGIVTKVIDLLFGW